MAEATLASLEVNIINLDNDVKEIKADVKSLQALIQTSYITRKEYDDKIKSLKEEWEAKIAPIRLLAYGATGTLLLGILSGLLAMLLKFGGG